MEKFSISTFLGTRENPRIPMFCFSFLMLFFFIQIHFSPSDGYDPMDPKGNITIKWDIMEWHDDIYTAVVTIFNFQLYRHIEKPGWKLSWGWEGKEVIWKMWGAQATEQGNCSAFKGGDIPHCCETHPVVLDLLPATPYNMQTSNCCKGGVLSSMTQDPAKYAASFKLVVGRGPVEGTNYVVPANFSLGVTGYTCAPAFEVPPSRFTADGGRRWTQALMTWNVTCSYSQFKASIAPTCCVSLSAFYNSTVVPCPHCSCSCPGSIATVKCTKPNKPSPLLQMPHDENEVVPPVVMCTQHLCPIRVHWHVKVSYKQYWRAKVTITNFNFIKNYSEWNLVVQHPNLQSLTQVFSFNYEPLHQYGTSNDTGMFWGIQHYNDMLLEAGQQGNVQTEMLLRKDPGLFTFNEGWAFPRKVSFNGDECVMPPPDMFPRLPNGTSTFGLQSPYNLMMMSFPLFLFIMFLL